MSNLNNKNSKAKAYAEKHKDPRWQKKRLKVFDRDDWCCQNCGDKSNTLHVYQKLCRDADPWDLPMTDLITLCEHCHDNETSGRQELENGLLHALRKAGVFSDGLGAMIEFYENQNCYSDLLADEKWQTREKELVKSCSTCFICNAETNLVTFHKCICMPTEFRKPWDLPDSDFDFICKSCNRTNRLSDLCNYFEFLIPAFHYAGYYEEDLIDLVSSFHLCNSLRLLLKEIRKERLDQIPNEFLESYCSKSNITYNQLMRLIKQSTKQCKLINIEEINGEL